MFERELMISGLHRQRLLLAALIAELEKAPSLDFEGRRFCNQTTKKVAHNLKKLRKIKDHYFAFREIEN